MRLHARGVTLVELLVVLAILGTMAGLVGLAWQPGVWSSLDRGEVARARRRALESGRVIKVSLSSGGSVAQVIAFPDGRVLGAEQLGVDPLTGESRDAIHPAH